MILASPFQDPDRDEVAARFPDPVPADRAWEMAAAYHQCIADAIQRQSYNEAREWERRANERLPFVYRSHIAEITREFWTHVASPPRNPDHFRYAREHVLRVLGAMAPEPNVGENPENPLLPLAQAAWLRAFQCRFDAAFDLLDAIDRTRPRSPWPKEIEDIRRDFVSLREAKDDPEALSKLTWRVNFAGPGSHQSAFSVLRKLKRLGGVPSAAAPLKAGAAYLRAIKDEAGAKAWEERLFTQKDIPGDELTSIILTRSNESFTQGDYLTADEGYRRILREWPKSKMMGRALYNLGFSLMKQKRFPEARAEFEKLLKADVNDNEPGDHIMELQRNYRPKAIVHIGECHESEGNWEKALEAYLDQRKYPMRSFCGNCSDSASLQAQTRIARCYDKLGRDDEAMKICREVLFRTDGGIGGRGIELCIIAVDIAVRTGRLDELERDLKKPPAKNQGTGHSTAALEYLRILRKRTAGDHAALFDVMRTSGILWHQYRWEDMRHRHRNAVEAAECLGELGDPAFEWLCEKVRSKSPDTQLALVAIAHFKSARALEFIRSMPLRPGTNDTAQRYMLEKIHSEAPRKRLYPPPPPQIKKQALQPGESGLVAALAIFVLGIVADVRSRRASTSR